MFTHPSVYLQASALKVRVCVCVITALTPFFTERLKYMSTYLYSVLFEDSTFNFLVDFSAKLLLHP